LSSRQHRVAFVLMPNWTAEEKSFIVDAEMLPFIFEQ
jgi:hypothetical protein